MNELALPPREIALFAGAGGGILGGKLLGWRTVCAVELDAYCRRVLLARQRDGFLPRFPIWDSVETFDGYPWRGNVDVVSGGFPCTDISAAKQNAEGIAGKASGLWGEMARIVGEIRPRFVFVENSPLLVKRGLAVVLGDLAEMGYASKWAVLGAHHAGAPHKREREFGSWVTPNARDWKDTPGMKTIRKDGRTKVDQTPRQVFQFWRKSIAADRGAVPSLQKGKTAHPVAYNPEFAEWLMGWPIGWTDLKPLETGKFRRWLRSHGVSSQKN